MVIKGLIAKIKKLIGDISSALAPNITKLRKSILEFENQLKNLESRSESGLGKLNRIEKQLTAIETILFDRAQKLSNLEVLKGGGGANVAGGVLLKLGGQIKDYDCGITNFFEEIKSYILKTDIVVDIGCGVRPQTFFSPAVHICIEPFAQYRNIIKPFFPNLSHFIFLKQTAEEAITVLDDESVDTIFLLDVIEHLEKEKGLSLIKECERVARRQVIVFTPLGFCPMHYEDASSKDAWGLDGASMQIHKSGWLPDDFGSGWDFHICVDCHEPFFEEEKLGGKKYSGLMAIFNKNFLGFRIDHANIPDFVIQSGQDRFKRLALPPDQLGN